MRISNRSEVPSRGPDRSFRRRIHLSSSMREKYDDKIHEESGHIIYDTKMAIRNNKRYLPYVFAFLIIWGIYHFITRPRPPPVYSCQFVTKQVHNYTWTFPDCPPLEPEVAAGKPIPVWTEECFRRELSEEVYGRPNPPADHQERVTPDSQIKVAGRKHACPPFPMEAFPKEHHEGRAAHPDGGAAQGATRKGGGASHEKQHHSHSPKFTKFAPGGWLYGVFAVHDTRIGPLSQIRIFAVSRIIPGEIYCQYTCAEQAHAVVSAPAKTIPLKIDDTKDDSCFWQQYMFVCEMRETTCTPGFASLSKAPCGLVSGIVPIIPAVKPSPPPGHKFAVCLSTIHSKSDSDTGYLAEVLEGNRHFGVEKIFLYGTHKVSRRYNAVLDVYKSQGLIEFIDWDIPSEISVVYKYAQLLQYSHCMYMNMREAHYVALTELEDVAFPTHSPDWNGFFQQLQTNERMDNVAYLTLERRSMCLPDLETNLRNVGDTLEDGRKLLELRIINQHALGEFHKVPLYIVNPAGVILPYIYQNKMVSVKGWRNIKVSTAMALTYYYGTDDEHCKKVDHSTRNDVTFCKEIPDITKSVINALSMLDLVNHGERKGLKSQDLVCT